ncbi:hypothetical protein VPH35_024076 [Triticum aestivum]
MIEEERRRGMVGDLLMSWRCASLGSRGWLAGKLSPLRLVRRRPLASFDHPHRGRGSRVRGQQVERRGRCRAAGLTGRRDEEGACGRLAEGEPSRLSRIYEPQVSFAQGRHVFMVLAEEQGC